MVKINFMIWLQPILVFKLSIAYVRNLLPVVCVVPLALCTCNSVNDCSKFCLNVFCNSVQ